MAYERSWTAVPPQLFTSNGTLRGTLQITNTEGFFVLQNVILQSTSQPSTLLQIKRIDADGTIYVGQPGDIILRQDISAFLTSDGATVSAPEQTIPRIKPDDVFGFMYERDPVKALRVEGVDPVAGVPWGKNNPMPVAFDGTIEVGEVSIVGNANPIYDQAVGTITSSSISTIYTYNSISNNTRIETLDVLVSTPALIQVFLNGTLIKERWTSPMQRTIQIKFQEPRQVPSGQSLVVKAQVDRFLTSSYDTFVSLEGFLEM